MLNKGAFALEIVRGDPELTADCRVTLNRGDRIGSLDCMFLGNERMSKSQNHVIIQIEKLKLPSQYLIFALTKIGKKLFCQICKRCR